MHAYVEWRSARLHNPFWYYFDCCITAALKPDVSTHSTTHHNIPNLVDDDALSIALVRAHKLPSSRHGVLCMEWTWRGIHVSEWQWRWQICMSTDHAGHACMCLDTYYVVLSVCPLVSLATPALPVLFTSTSCRRAAVTYSACTT